MKLLHPLGRLTALLLLFFAAGLPERVRAANVSLSVVDAQIAAHPGQSGAFVLDSGEQALLARAWLADHAVQSIEVQYFIWSTDNIGILASEALLRAAERGVQVRVIVDDLMITAPDSFLLAVARHPKIDIRIYNPKHSVGVRAEKRVLNVAGDFRGANQRMHDKTFIVDGIVAITGGRNMAAEYFDYNREYNFRDRDVLLLGEVVKSMRASFEAFWTSELCAKVETLYDGIGLMERKVSLEDKDVHKIYRALHDYANAPDNFAPEVRAAISAAPATFSRLAEQVVWGEVEFISDRPGKNVSRRGLGGGGLTTAALAALVEDARESIVIQSPYLVMSDAAMALFRKVRARGVRVRINTNSLASTDNLPAFSGYRNQREALLEMGLEIYEYKPDSALQLDQWRRSLGGGGHAPTKVPDKTQRKPPLFALHAKTMVVDATVVYIGTFNFDPRSENLNTEVGVIIRNEKLAREVEAAIEIDMQPVNSWNTAREQPDQHVGLVKRSKVRLLQLLPIKPLL